MKIKRIVGITLILGLLMMCYETIRVRTEYLKGYYDFTDLMMGLSLIIFSNTLIFISEILISYFYDWRSSSCIKKVWRCFLYFEMILGIFTLLFYIFAERLNIYCSYYNTPFLQSLISFSDCVYSSVLLVASITSQCVLKNKKIENNHKKI